LNISIVIPVFNRPEELSELLNSIANQDCNDFEVIVVEDGSTNISETVCRNFQHKIPLQYIKQENKGPGIARNTGAIYAKGNWIIFLDSDCILPNNYLKIVKKEIITDRFDCFGGPDMAHTSFNSIQKAIGYAMSSILTTGGIRGAKESFDIFYPRSFNLGVKKEIFNSLSGFSDMRYGEDLDFSMRLLKKGFSTQLLKNVYVFHKRRNNFVSFFKQVHNSGIARINLENRHPGTIKPVHCLPTLFIFGNLLIIALAFIIPLILIFLAVFPALILIHAAIKTKEVKTTLLAVIASFVQLFGYGSGFFKALILKFLNLSNILTK